MHLKGLDTALERGAACRDSHKHFGPQERNKVTKIKIRSVMAGIRCYVMALVARVHKRQECKNTYSYQSLSDNFRLSRC